MACRSISKAETAKQEMLQELGEAQRYESKLTIMALDLGDLTSIKEFVQEFTSKFARIDLLVNNAGLFVDRYVPSKQGIETTFAVNHLGPFYLTLMLFDKIAASGESRIINVASQGQK